MSCIPNVSDGKVGRLTDIAYVYLRSFPLFRREQHTAIKKFPPLIRSVHPEYRDYFMVGECVRFLFTSCEESQTNEWAQRTSEFAILHNKWIKIVQANQPWSNLYLFHKYQFCSLSHCGCLGMVQILLSSACIVQSMINEHEHEQTNTTVLHLNYTWVTMMSSESHVVAVSTRLPRGTRDYIHFVSSLSSICTQSPTTSSPSSTSHIPLRVIDDHISTSIQY